jgi:hypothetical protein
MLGCRKGFISIHVKCTQVYINAYEMQNKILHENQVEGKTSLMLAFILSV